ncbi:UDP-N-acetylmuramoyl-tripeptide--D-alanyl-D-alanine ligase [Shewanella gelidii]|uniref:UDP-N-acetylmuramoyl-tripeptide--D-alanyl-D-alanine ligase n=1 Tax=Shewanella gelidii TaxID=1642821 RepID=A0A917NC61_9GAMM|nr:UDP-N-acetylmuramoyl-tripeptide--D-alanyl-D-alanine ligase [Shewanella gelidii]MCL1098380.1 UDP-N-acetylmuramoyl-tripeptide--D-alanyl-D-alanine ligase [Shewanella gelidii]GGI83154.1 UDP-N-acetylmuramoyl-tripeptide--D-alanyl-D-alanine ligase [Shewanella gelidii]
MIPLNFKQVATHLQAKLVNFDSSSATMFEQVSTDSRNIQPKTLFVALKGERFDGHDFAMVAYENGAQALLVEKVLPIAVPQLIVNDTLKALGQLGALVSSMVAPKRVALTGSNGKTTVKEMVSSILATQFKVLFTAGNFNNEIGVPLTLLRLSAQDQVGVFELGANHLGEIDYTSSLVKPDVALVNNVASAHLEGFGSQDGVAQAKSEIFSHLQAQGTAVINLDDDYWPVMQAAAGSRSRLYYSVNSNIQLPEGVDLNCFVSVTNTIADHAGCYQFELCHQGQQQPIQLKLMGRHQVANALAASCIALALGLSLSQICQGLEAMEPVKGRMVPAQLGSVQVVDDSYNANPASVKAAIHWLQEIQNKTCLVLGDLGELGENAAALHRQLGQYAKSQGVDALFCTGQLTQETSDEFGAEHHQDIESLCVRLIEYIQQSSQPLTVLVKGSRSSAMERVIERLSAAYERGEFV